MFHILQLKKLGFKRIDGLDPSEEMLNRARDRNMYENYLQEFLTAEPLNIPDSKLWCIGIETILDHFVKCSYANPARFLCPPPPHR